MEQQILELLNKTKISINYDRKSSGKGRSRTLGTIKNIYLKCHGYKNYYVNSKFTDKNLELRDLVFAYGKMVCPFDFTSVQVNKNYKCDKHKDKGNYGDTLIVALGDFTGGELVVEFDDGEKFVDIKNRPFIFNGSQHYHYVNDYIGTRYSLVFHNQKREKIRKLTHKD